MFDPLLAFPKTTECQTVGLCQFRLRHCSYPGGNAFLARAGGRGGGGGGGGGGLKPVSFNNA